MVLLQTILEAVKLVDSAVYGNGVIEIYNDLTKKWGRICNKNLAKNVADVTCKHLGFKKGALEGRTYDILNDQC